MQSQYLWFIRIRQEEVEDTKGEIRICNLKDRQHNVQKKRDKQWYTKTLHRKLKIEQHEPHKKRGSPGKVGSFCSLCGTVVLLQYIGYYTIN